VDERQVQRLGRRLQSVHRYFPGLPRPAHRRAPTSLEDLEAELAWSRAALEPFLKRDREIVAEQAPEEHVPARVILRLTPGRTERSGRSQEGTGAILKATSLRQIAAEIALLKSQEEQSHQEDDDRLLRVEEVLRRVGVKSRVTLWRWVREARFPKPRQVGPNVVRWSDREVREWMAQQKAKGE
jgi:predicted DNA-binding transcriptional regulator AlpA